MTADVLAHCQGRQGCIGCMENFVAFAVCKNGMTNSPEIVSTCKFWRERILARRVLGQWSKRHVAYMPTIWILNDTGVAH